MADLKNLENKAITSTSAVGRTGTKAKVSWKAGTGVTVHSVTYDGTPVEFGQEIDLKTGGTFKVAYSLAEAAPAPAPVSYTHLDVYKRQVYCKCNRRFSSVGRARHS